MSTPSNAHPAWRSPIHSIRDALTFASGKSIEAIRETAFAVLDRLQFSPPATQLDALYVVAVAMANSLGLDPHDLVTRAKRLIPDLDAFNEHLNAVRDYTHGELKK